MSNVKFLNNDEGVSPIIATLVLIVVAIVGAAAVGLIMGSFSSQVSQQANVGNTQSSAANTIAVAGSTSMQPVITTLAQWYTSNNTGVKVTVSGGGSGAGAIAAGSGLADIGMMSEKPTSAQTTKYPNLQTYIVGASGVVFASNNKTVVTTASKTELAAAFGYDTTIAGKFGGVGKATGNLSSITEVVTRADVSGTSDTAFNWMGSTTGTVQPTSGTGSATSLKAVAVNGNGAVATQIGSDLGALGYLESDYAFGSTSTAFHLVNVSDGSAQYVASWSNIQSQLQYNPTTVVYPLGLLRPLCLVTNGKPNAMTQGFIDYVENPATYPVFDAAHQVQVSRLAATLNF